MHSVPKFIELHYLIYVDNRLLALKERLQAQKKHIEELDKHMYAFSPDMTLQYRD
jgi:hypothetical protein